MDKFWELVNRFKDRTKYGDEFRVPYKLVEETVPHFWREEAGTIDDWIVRSFRGAGVAARFDSIDGPGGGCGVRVVVLSHEDLGRLHYQVP